MAEDAKIWCYTTSPYSRVQTTTNPENLQTIPTLGAGKFQRADVGDLQYLEHTAHTDLANTEQLLTTPANAGVHTKSMAAAKVWYVVQRFATEAGNPNWAGDLKGDWTFNIECEGVNLLLDYNFKIRALIYKVDTDDNDTLLGTSNEKFIGTQGFQQFTWASTGTLAADDRIKIVFECKWYDPDDPD